MSVLQKMISTQAALFAYMLAGVICRRLGVIQSDSRRYFNAMLTKICLPCMICASFLIEITREELVQAGMMLLYSAVICSAEGLIALLLWRRADDRRRPVLQFSTMFSNAGNAGIPVVSMVFGDLGVLYTSYFLIPIRCFMWTLGLTLFMGGGKREKGLIKKLLMNPCLLAVFVGMALMALPFSPPDWLVTPVRGVGNMVGPLSMMIIGSTLMDMKPRDMLDRQAWLASLVRLLVIPVLVMAACRLMGLPALCWQVAVTLIAMPVATLTVVFAETHGGDHLFASRCVFISTILSLVTVPLVTMLF